jgi:hypothetical protein
VRCTGHSNIPTKLPAKHPEDSLDHLLTAHLEVSASIPKTRTEMNSREANAVYALAGLASTSNLEVNEHRENDDIGLGRAVREAIEVIEDAVSTYGLVVKMFSILSETQANFIFTGNIYH